MRKQDEAWPWRLGRHPQCVPTESPGTDRHTNGLSRDSRALAPLCQGQAAERKGCCGLWHRDRCGFGPVPTPPDRGMRFLLLPHPESELEKVGVGDLTYPSEARAPGLWLVAKVPPALGAEMTGLPMGCYVRPLGFPCRDTRGSEHELHS